MSDELERLFALPSPSLATSMIADAITSAVLENYRSLEHLFECAMGKYEKGAHRYCFKCNAWIPTPEPDRGAWCPGLRGWRGDR